MTIDFNLELLGWKNFQDLALAIAESHYGMHVRAFAAGRDGGRDGAATFPATLDTGAPDSEITIQAKHTSTAGTLTLDTFKNELPKVRTLYGQGYCDEYYLFTNLRLSATSDIEISEAIKQTGVRRVNIIGKETIQHILTHNKRLRGLVPRVYGLGDLGEILGQRLSDQTLAILKNCEPEKFVPTTSYEKVLNALVKHKFALLLGLPGAGKSSIMSMAAMYCADRWSLSPAWLASIEQLNEHWDPNRSDQLFLLDDAFGALSLDTWRTNNWNQLLPFVKSAIDNGSRFILTSRGYVFSAARNHLRQDQLPISKQSEVVISVEELSIEERRQILYNHLKHSDHGVPFLRALKPHLNELTWKTPMLPMAASRLGKRIFSDHLDPQNMGSVEKFLRNSGAYLYETINALERNQQHALVLLAAQGGRIDVQVPSFVTRSEIWRRLDLDVRSLALSLSALEGTFVVLVLHDEGRFWAIKHPSILDALGDWMLAQDELLDTYVASAPIDHLLRQVACGDNVPGAIALPKNLWLPTLDRLMNIEDDIQSAVRFLAYRCRSPVLRELASDVDLSQPLRGYVFNSPLEWDPGVRLFLRLESDSLLDEDLVRELFDSIIRVSVTEFDPYVMRNLSFQSLVFNHSTIKVSWPTIVEAYLEEINMNVGTYVKDRITQYISETPRQDVFAQLLDLISALSEWIDDRHPAYHAMSREEQRIRSWCAQQVLSDAATVGQMRAFVRMVFAGTYDENIDIFSDIDA